MSRDISPSNLRQLPLETYMIPIPNTIHEQKENDKKEDDKKEENITMYQSFQDFQNMSPSQQSDFMIIQYHKLMEQLRSTTSFLDLYETMFVTFLAESLSGKKNTENDVKIIKRNFILLFNVLLSCCIVYNWYYLMFYLDESGNRIDSYKFSLQTLQEKQPIVHVIFKYTLCVLSIVTSTLLDKIPSTLRCISVDSKINKMIQFIFLLGFVLCIVTMLGKNILELVGSTEFVGFFVVTFVLYGIYTFASEFTDKDPFVITTRMKKYTAFGQMTPLLYMMLFFLRILWSISTIIITALSNFFFLIINSFFAMTCYSEKSIITTIHTIHSFIRKENENEKTKETMFKNVVNFFIEYLYTFLFEFVLIITLTISLFDYSLKMNDTKKLQITMTTFCSTFIFLLCFIIYQRFTFLDKIKTETSTTTTTTTTNTIPVTTSIPSIPSIITNTNIPSSTITPTSNMMVDKISSLLPSSSSSSTTNTTSNIVDNVSSFISEKIPSSSSSTISDSISSLLPNTSNLSSNSTNVPNIASLSSLATKPSSLSNTMMKSPTKVLSKMLNILRKK